MDENPYQAPQTLPAPTPPDPGRVGRWIGNLLIGLGGLWSVMSISTLVALISVMAIDRPRKSQAPSILIMAALVNGALAAGMFWYGRRLRRKYPAPKASESSSNNESDA